MDEIEEICSVPGIDIIFFGPGDFSQSVGKPGDLNCSEVVSARKKVAECALKHGKFAGTVGSIQNVNELHDLGYQFVNLGADVVSFGQYCINIQEKLVELLGHTPVEVLAGAVVGILTAVALYSVWM